jgi:hypothetical protein
VDAINELIKSYGLEEDGEHVIIPYTAKDGKKKRTYLLKRRFIRIIYSEEHYVDYPLEVAIEATVRYPELVLSEAIYRMHRELADNIHDMSTKGGEHKEES